MPGGSVTRSGRTPKLARRLVEPTWLSEPVWVQTFGPEVCDINTTANFEPDPEQELILNLIFAIGEDGRSAAFEVDIIGPRQNFKTGVIKQAELGWLFVTEERLIVHSAHELDTTEEAFGDLRALIENTPSLAKHLDRSIGDKDSPGIIGGNGKWSIYVLGSDGQRLRVKYKARTKSGGRGLTGNKIVLDEGFALTPQHVGSLYPTLTVVEDPQVITASSAGLLMSDVLRDKRDRGRVGATPRQAYIEYGDRNAHKGCRDRDCDHAKTREGCALDDERRWAKIMPQFGRRARVETVRSMRASMPPEQFAQEFMVWWEDPPEVGTGLLDLERWARFKDAAAKQPKRATLVLDVSPDRRHGSIGVVGRSGRRRLGMVKHGSGTSWMVPAVVKLLAKRDIVEVALNPSSQAGVLIKDLEKAGVEIYRLTSQEVGAACGAFIALVNGEPDEPEDADLPDFVHLGQPEVDAAVTNATTRHTGEVEIWDRREWTGPDISPVVALSGALQRWAAHETDEYDVLDSVL